MLDFLAGAELIIHNAPYDVGFLNREFERAGYGYNVVGKYCHVLDTLTLARRLHPSPNTLDALCDRYSIDRSRRIRHGHSAKLDAELLAGVYLKMPGTPVVKDPDQLIAPSLIPDIKRRERRRESRERRRAKVKRLRLISYLSTLALGLLLSWWFFFPGKISGLSAVGGVLLYSLGHLLMGKIR